MNENDIAEDVYTIICEESKKSLQLDLTTPFVMNSIATLINVPYENISIKNSVGEVVSEIDKESLLKITETNELSEKIHYYFLNLVDILFDPIEVEGYTYSKLYPLKELEKNEYGLSKGKIVTGKDIIVKIKGYELIKSEVDIVKIVNYTNGNYIKRIDSDFTYHAEQTLGNIDLKNIVKLNNNSIEKGSIVIEEYYENGENFTSNPTNNLRYLNVNTTEDPAYLEVDIDTYLQE